MYIQVLLNDLKGLVFNNLIFLLLLLFLDIQEDVKLPVVAFY